MLAHSWFTLIAIFSTPEIPTVILRVLKESYKITDTYHIYSRFQAVAVMHGTRQHHVAAITAAKDCHTVFIQIRLGGDPIQ